MSNLEYVNARLRSIRSHRLPAKQLDTLLASGSLRSLAEGLGSTRYGDALSRAGEDAGTLPGIDRAVSEVHRDVLDRCMRYSESRADSPLAIYLGRVHVQNLKVILRAVQSSGSFEDAEPALVPFPPLDRRALEELCAQETTLAVAGALMSWGVPLGSALARAIRFHPEGTGLDLLDHALDEAYYSNAVKTLAGRSGRRDAAVEALQDEIDLANLRMALRAASGRTGKLPLSPLSQGRLNEAFLEQVAGASSLGDAVSLLSQTVFRAALQDPLLQGAGEDLGKIERALERARLARLSTRALQDPMGIAFTLRFLAETEVETQNLRLIARTNAGLIPPQAAEEAMIHV